MSIEGRHAPGAHSSQGVGGMAHWLAVNAGAATAAAHHSQKPGMLESMTALRTVKGMSALPAWAASDSSSERPLEDVSSASSVESCR